MKLLQEAAPPGLRAPELSRLHFAPYMPVTKLLNQNQKQSLDRGRKFLSGFLLENCALIHFPPEHSPNHICPPRKHCPLFITALKTECCLRVCINNPFQFLL